ncbi:hypothetical protein CPAV1605_190 [seawater metagenome]|uniref:Uncharacterized protein n=1 Tax=seawater metagenome TaxID=1561972 RepID=A0A5E8CGC7_9ZZZZ
MQLPEEIIRYILDFNFNTNRFLKFNSNKEYFAFNLIHNPKLFKCHSELMLNRPYYYKKVIAGFTPGISDSSNWHNFSRNEIINICNRYNSDIVQVKLHAIEITPERPDNNYYWHSRDIYLYYGWVRKKELSTDPILSKEYSIYDFRPGQY